MSYNSKEFDKPGSIQVTESSFGELAPEDYNENHVVKKYTLSNSNGMEVSVISYGASIASICVPDGVSGTKDVMLSFDDVNHPQFRSSGGIGSVAGRVASFIAHGKFELAGKFYQVDQNHRGHHLHGGSKGFHTKNWDSEVVEGSKLLFTCRSSDGEEGYPGEVEVQATYELTAENQLILQFHAVPNKSTPINLTSHGLFNLGGHDAADQRLVDHVIQINADHFTVADNHGILNGQIVGVEGTNFDFRVAKELNPILESFPPGPHGFNVNFCIKQGDCEADMHLVARIANTKTKISMEVFSDQPCVQFYTGQHWPDPAQGQDAFTGKSGAKYMKYGFFALETQQFPNAVNVASFPSTVISAGDSYRHRIVYKFTIL